ncbi:MAG TPA: hypothetical protein VGQ99_19705 [Tepidisphaeraceae bacterium]|jgi:hypothetical protein|nr:hypothetical protein [Tepidisphaeraceae bacterium]
MPAKNQNRADLPIWLAIPIVIAALVIGGFLIFHDVQPPARPTVQTIDINHASTTPASSTMTPPKTFVDPSPANFDKKIFNQSSKDALRKTSETSWSVKGGRLFMQVRRDNTGKLAVRYVYPYEDFLPKDTVAMLRTRWIMTETVKLMDELQITADQWEKLNAIKLNTDTQIPAAERKKLMALFEEAIAAMPKNEIVNGGLPTVAEEKLTDFLREMDEKYYDTTIARANRLAEDVKALFTETQYAGLMRRYGTW